MSSDLGQSSPTYVDNVTISSDVSTRVLRLFLDVSTLDAGANVTIRMVDAVGDYSWATLDPR